LTFEKDNTDKVVKYVDEVKRLGLDLFPPDINKSDLVFSATKIDGKEVVMFGMGAIKGVGDVAINSILTTRKKDGVFVDLADFISRIDGSKVNKRVIEALIKSGAFDGFGYSRRAMFEQVELIGQKVTEAMQKKKQSTGSLFGQSEDMIRTEVELEHMEEYSSKEILEFERATLGFYVSGHPLDEYREQLDGISYTLSSQLDEVGDGSEALFIGKVQGIVEKISKKGNKFAIVNIMDLHGNIELMMFEDRLKELRDDFDLDEPIAFKVRVTKDDQFTKINLRKIETLKEAKKEKLKTKRVQKEEPPLTLAIPFINSEQIVYDLHEIVAHNQGKRALSLIIKSKLADIEVQTGFKVTSKVEELAKNIQGVYAV
jgi:DNA polymerase-3 subunit alpha